MQVGDIVRLKPEPWRTARIGMVTGRFNALILHILWVDETEERVNQMYLEVVSHAFVPTLEA